jgi:hypothetical protein
LTAEKFGAVGPPYWSDRPVFLLGGGASLCGFDFGRLAGWSCRLGVNQAMLDADCDAGLSIDHPFVRRSQDRLCTFAADRQLYLAAGDRWFDDLPEIPGAIYLGDAAAPLSRNPALIHGGGTSGYAALNLAVLKRARRIVLLGYDYGLVAGRHHYHDAYWWHHAANDQSWAAWAKRFDAMAPALEELGVEVINASPQSAIACFPKMSIEDALEWADQPC